jgi:hypothetical protein
MNLELVQNMRMDACSVVRPLPSSERGPYPVHKLRVAAHPGPTILWRTK